MITKRPTPPPRRVAPRSGGWALGLEVRHLRAFVTLVDEGSMTAAARRLGVAQSTVSEALTALERALGTPAIARRRGVHGVELTPAGQALLPYGRNVLASLEDAHVAVAAVAQDVPGRIELISNESVSTYLLAPALDVLRTRWPNIEFSVSVARCDRIRQGLTEGSFDVGLMLQVPACEGGKDLAIMTQPPFPSSAIPLRNVPLIVFARANHPLAARTSNGGLRVDELSPYPLFASDASGYFHDLLAVYFHGNGRPGPRLQSTGSVEAVKRTVLTNSEALGVLPAYAVAEELQASQVRAIRLAAVPPSLRLHAMVYRTREPKHPVITDLLEMLGDGRLA